MMKPQPDLFSYPRAPGWSEPTTSRAAAVAIRPHVAAQQQKLLDFLRAQGLYGATYLELAAGTGVSPQSICGRMVELVHARLVTFSKELTRPTPSGRQARVYVLKEFRS